MSKGGVSLIDVRIARDKLISQGERPSVRKIVKMVGGSNSTVQKFMLELDAMGDGQLFGEQGLLHKLFHTAHGQLHDLFLQEVAIARSEAQSKVEQLQSLLNEERQAREAMENALSLQKTEHKDTRTALSEMTERHAAVAEQVRLQEQTLEANARDLLQSRNEINDLKQTLEARSQQHLEFIHSTQERQRSASAEYEAKLLGHQTTHANLLAAAKAEFKADKVDLQRQLDDANNDRIALNRDNSALVQKLAGLEAQIAGHDRELSAMTQELNSTRTQLSQSTEQAAIQKGLLQAMENTANAGNSEEQQ